MPYKVCVMHLDSLTIKNFRILEDVTIEKLGHVNLIVAPQILDGLVFV